MKKLAIISTNGAQKAGGVERVVGDHERTLSEYAYVKIVSLPAGPLASHIRKIKLFDLFFRSFFPLISPLIARAWAGRKGVVMTHGCSSIGYFCDVAFGHGCWAAYMEQIHAKPGPFSKIMILYERLTARNSKKVVLVSDRVKEQWVKKYNLSETKAQVLINSVNTSIFHPQYGSPDPFTTRYIRVLFVGSCTRPKGFDYLVRLHAEIIDSEENLEVCICSPQDVDEEIKERLHRFRFLCHLDTAELMNEYNKADIFLLPSLYEAFEMSSLESLACGTPVMLNDTGARPTLHRLGCSAVYCLEEEPSPLRAILSAKIIFTGLKREDIANWTKSNLGINRTEAELVKLCVDL